MQLTMAHYSVFNIIATVIVAIVLIVGLTAAILTVYLRRNRVKGIPYVSPPGLLQSFINLPNFHSEILRLTKLHNGLFQSRILFDKVVFISRPDIVREALTKVTNKGWMYELLAFIPGCLSIFEANTKEWEIHSRCFKSSFSMNAVNNNASGVIHQFTDKFCDQLSDKIKQNTGKAEIHVDHLFSALTVDIISKAGFDYDIGALDGSAEYNGLMQMLHDYMRGLRQHFGNPLFELMTWKPEVKQFNDASRKLYCSYETILDHVFAKYGDKSDLNDGDTSIASGLVKLSKQPGITRNHLISDVATFLVAGHDTTAHSLSFICYLLASNPRVQQLGQEAVDDFLKESPNHSANMCHDYVDAIIKEGMRLFPVAAAGSIRRVGDPNGVSIGQYHLPNGTWVQTPFYDLQNWDKIWGDDVGEFKPERWLNDGSHPNISPQGLGGYSGVHMKEDAKDLCFFPFSFGLRKCIGMNLAIIELKAVVTRILSQFTLELPDELKGIAYEDMAEYDFTLRPKANLKLFFRLRD